MKTLLHRVALSLVLTLGFTAGASSGPPPRFSEQEVMGPSAGNHELDCLVIRPWTEAAGPEDRQYPIIGWANGWDQGNVAGELTTLGYKPGLVGWATAVEAVVIAANQWSAREPDLVRCLEWLVAQDTTPGSEYQGRIDESKIGVAGHSQGGGAALKTGDGGSGLTIAAIVAMNPYGPNWASLGDLLAPALFLGGEADTTTPPSSYIEVWDQVLLNGEGGIFALLPDGTHNSEAWGVDDDGNTLDVMEAAELDFGRYQRPSELFWSFLLNDDGRAGRELERLLQREPWLPEFHFVGDFVP